MRLGPQNRICPVSGRSGPRNLLLLSVQTGVLHDLLENVDLPTFLHRHDHVVRLIYHLRVQLLAGRQTPAQEPVPGALQAAVLLQRCGGDAPGGDGQVNPGGLVECQSRAAGETVPPVLAVPPATLAGPAVRRGYWISGPRILESYGECQGLIRAQREPSTPCVDPASTWSGCWTQHWPARPRGWIRSRSSTGRWAPPPWQRRSSWSRRKIPCRRRRRER